VFNNGHIEQVGTGAEIYEHPTSAFVAGFVGTSNLLGDEASRALFGRGGSNSIRPEKLRLLPEGGRPGTVSGMPTGGSPTSSMPARSPASSST
jgi:putative spermidine/putrescine transport system ATP-binding protein